MHVLATALGLSLLGSCGGLLVASTLVSFPSHVRTRLVPWLVSYAVGALLGVALLDILPEALTLLAPQAVFGTLLAGILLFFTLEKLVLLRHCHTDECEVHGATAPLLFIGDGFHNFIDGAIICSAVMTSVPLGVSTAIAVAAHEIPQEVGDVAILLASGYSRGRALLLNVVSGGASIGGALVAFAAVQVVPGVRPLRAGDVAASLLYIAMSDLIPNLHKGEIDAQRRASGAADRRRHRHHRVLRKSDWIDVARQDEPRDRREDVAPRSRGRRDLQASREPRTGSEAQGHPDAARRPGRQARRALVGTDRRLHRARPGSKGSRARPVVVPADFGSERRPAPPGAGGKQGRGGIRPIDAAAEQPDRSSDRRGGDARGA